MLHGDIIKKALKNHHGHSASNVKSNFLKKKLDNFKKTQNSRFEPLWKLDNMAIFIFHSFKLVEKPNLINEGSKKNHKDVNLRPQNLAKIVRFDNLDSTVYIWGIECCIAFLALTVDSLPQKNWIPNHS